MSSSQSLPSSDLLHVVDEKLSEFLEASQGRLVEDSIRKLVREKSALEEEFKDKFKPVVHRHLPNFLECTWMALLFWDGANRRMRVLYDHRDEAVDKRRYSKLRDFLASQAFVNKGFVEPMTEFVFAEADAKNEPLVLQWHRKDNKSEVQQTEGTPTLIDLDGLNDIDGVGEAIAGLMREIGDAENEYIADQILEVSESILTTEEGKEVLEEAARKIEQTYFSGKNGPDNLGAKLCRSLIWNRVYDDRWQHLYYVPAKYALYSSVSGIVCATEDPLEKDQYIKLLYVINRIFSPFHVVLRSEQVQLESYRSAVSTVMSRNMSHNIGSHALARLTSPGSLRAYYDKEKEGTPDKDDPLKPVALLNSYLRTRMDFLADVATGASAVAMSKRLYRDTCAYFENDEGIDRQEILLDKISGTNLDGDSIELEVHFDGQRITRDSLEQDPLVAFPSDMLGAHALYIVFENIIRNCAKHGDLGEDDELKLTVEVSESPESEEHFRVRIFDNIENTCSKLAETVDDLNAGIDRSILTEGELREGYWGVLEMKIAAAYLRQIDPAQIDASHDPALLKAIPSDDRKNLGYELYLKKHRLALVLDFGEEQMQDGMHGDRPRKQEESTLVDTSVKLEDSLKKMGVEVEEGKARLDEGGNEAHDFLVLVRPSADDLKSVAENAKALPQKILVCDSQSDEPVPGEDCYTQVRREEVESKLQSGDAAEISCWLWESWTENVFDGQPLPTLKKGSRRPLTICEGEGTSTFLFDHHGNFHPSIRQEADYYEPYGSTTPMGIILKNTLDWGDFQKRQLCAELRASSAFEVAVVDERIQEAAAKQSDEDAGENVDKVLEMMGVYVPPAPSEEPDSNSGESTSRGEAIDLNEKTFDEEMGGRIKDWIDERLRSGVECLVIHLGIIEKIVGTGNTEIGDWIDEIEKKHDLKHDCRKSIVVISGRGTPSNLPDDTRFLNYSLVARYLFEKRSKYHLCKILSSARKQPSEQA